MVLMPYADVAIPTKDYDLFDISLQILVSFDQKLKNDTQIYLALKRFQGNIPHITESNGLTLSELVGYINNLWRKHSEKLGGNSGKICKIFYKEHFQEGKNIWRNPINTQKIRVQ